MFLKCQSAQNRGSQGPREETEMVKRHEESASEGLSRNILEKAPKQHGICSIKVGGV